MSHFTKVKTVIREQEVLCEALRALHHQFQEGENLTVRGYSGNRETAQVVVNTGSQYDIGFQRQADQTFTCCAAWWGVRGNTQLREETFLRDVNRTYAHLNVRRQIEEQGLILEEERVLDNGEIELVVCERAF